MLNKREIRDYIEQCNLVEHYIHLETQLTPNGFDATVGHIFAFDEAGSLDFSNRERSLPKTREIPLCRDNPEDSYGWWDLEQGVYKVKTNETVNLPADLIALAFTRTSLLRMGACTHHGVWDAGFSGKSEFILVVANSHGLRLKQNSRVVQLVFQRVAETERYDGIYQETK